MCALGQASLAEGVSLRWKARPDVAEQEAPAVGALGVESAAGQAGRVVS